MSKEIAVKDESGELSSWTPRDVMSQINSIQQLMRDGMKENEHWGVVPGTSGKAVLLKPGAEKLCLMFRLAPKFTIEEKDLGNGHINVNVRCSLQHINTGKFFGEGVGSCSTMESKYRYRVGQGTSTGVRVPKEYWDLKRSDPKAAQEKIGAGYGVKKEDGVWYICERVEKQENPDIADVYNTVLKMAKKRALVDATLTATAASDIFTQDLEETLPEDPKKPVPEAKVADSISQAPPAYVQKALEAPISHDQQLEIHRKAKERGIEPQALKTALEEIFQVSGTAKITAGDYPTVLEWINSQESALVGQ